jgi:hypothetical protein
MYDRNVASHLLGPYTGSLEEYNEQPSSQGGTYDMSPDLGDQCMCSACVLRGLEEPTVRVALGGVGVFWWEHPSVGS